MAVFVITFTSRERHPDRTFVEQFASVEVAEGPGAELLACQIVAAVIGEGMILASRAVI